jgi:mono/diheme cytochrome c family protein
MIDESLLSVYCFVESAADAPTRALFALFPGVPVKATLLVLPSLLWTSYSYSAADVNYAKDVQPILAKSCVRCHGAAKAKGKLRLDTAAATLKGGRSGPSVIPGKSSDSPLFQSVSGTGEAPKMPPKGPGLSQNQIALLKSWIDSGAKAPAGEKPALAAGDTIQQRDGDERERQMKHRGRFRKGRGRERERERDKNEREKRDKD